MAGHPSGLPGLEGDVARHFDRLSTRGQVMCEYIWVGGSGGDLRSKTKVLNFKPRCVEELPIGQFDGALTAQANGRCSTVYLKPRMLASDPFRGGDHILVLCDTFAPPELEAGQTEPRPHPSNNRAPCEAVMQAAAAHEPVFSVEQQYTLLDPATGCPIGWPERASIERAGGSYCSVGIGPGTGRDFAESHSRACLHAGIPITGSSSEAVPGQWSFKLGPCSGLEVGDRLWLARYILQRCAERHGLKASLDPQPVPGDWSGSGAFVKYSTRETRDGNGKAWAAIQRHLQLLEGAHLQHLMVYGSGNSQRLLRQRQLSPALGFCWGLEDRQASLRIPHSALLRRCGWYEDRRPASNMDPYLVTMMLACTTLGVPLPLAPAQAAEGSDESGASEASRGSSAILSELDRQESFAPETPPQQLGLLAGECSSRRA